MSENSLTHYGILGQKWGVRRFQYEDGSLTPEGRKRYGANGEYDTTRYKSSSYKSDGYTGRTKMADYKNMSKEELREMVERMELENRYLRAVDARRGKTYVEKVAARANTVANLTNSANQILQFATGKNFSQTMADIHEKSNKRTMSSDDISKWFDEDFSYSIKRNNTKVSEDVKNRLEDLGYNYYSKNTNNGGKKGK